MKYNLTLYLAAAALTVSACSPYGAPPPQTEAQVLSATHAFDSKAPIAGLAFSPNDVASWLGAIAWVTDRGDLLISDIEGKAPKVQTGAPYSDVIGTNRKGAPALFLALTEDGALRPFIEADNDGNFKAVPISSDAGRLKVLCKTASGITDTLTAITASGDIEMYSVEIGDSVILRKAGSVAATKSAEHCAASGDAVYTLSGTTLAITGGIKTQIPEGATGLALHTNAETLRLAVSRNSEPSLSFYSADDLSNAARYRIEPGLSIAGLSGASAIGATSAAFGGSAFNDGIIAMADIEASRLVILSGSYVSQNLSETMPR